MHSELTAFRTARRRRALLVAWIGFSAILTVAANQAPVAGPVPGLQQAAVDRAWLYRWPADLFSDPDGDPLTVSVEMADGSAWPGWLEANPADRTFSGVVQQGQSPTTLVFRVRAEDPGGLSATNEIPVELIRIPPELERDVCWDRQQGCWRYHPSVSNRVETLSMAMNSFRGHNDRHLTYSLSGGPDELWIDPYDGFMAMSPIPMEPARLLVECGDPYWEKNFDDRCVGPTNPGVYYARATGDFTLRVTDGVDEAFDGVGYRIWYALHTVEVAPGELFDFTLRPGEAFDRFLPLDRIHSSGDNPMTVVLQPASITTNNSLLPDWIDWDPETGRIYGTAPETCYKLQNLHLFSTDFFSGHCRNVGFTITIEAEPLEVVAPTPTVQMLAGSSTNLSFASTFSYSTPTSLVMTATQDTGEPLPDWMTFDPDAMTLQISPGSDVNANVSVEVTAEDPCCHEAVDAFLVAVQSPKPQQQHPLLDQTWIGGQAGSYTFHPDTFVSPEGLSLTYSAELDDGDDLPAWLSFDDSTRTFSGTPHDFSDQIEILITARDTRGALIDGTLSLTVYSSGSPPACPAGSDGSVSLGVNQTLVFDHADFPVSDFNRSLHRLRVAGLPAQGTLALHGSAITNGTVVTADDLFDEAFTFVPETDAAGDPYTTFSFAVHDGYQEACQTNWMTLSVTGAVPAAQAAALTEPVVMNSTSEDGHDVETLFNQRDTRCFPRWMAVEAGQTGEVNVLEHVLDFDVDRHGETISLLGVTQPDHGTVSVLSNGVVRYVNNGLSLDNDHFTYTAGTSNGLPHTSDVHVRVHHPRSGTLPPVVTNHTVYTAGGAPIDLRPDELAMDPDGLGSLRFRGCIAPIHGEINVQNETLYTYYPEGPDADDKLYLLVEDEGHELAVARLTVGSLPGNGEPAVWIRGGDQEFETFSEETVLTGGCNTSCVGNVVWTNQATGESGQLPAASSWTVTLDQTWVGTSEFTLSASNLTGTVIQRTYTLTKPLPDTVFVSPEGLHEYPYASWTTAANELQSAVDAVAENGIVWVTNGVYQAGGRKNYSEANLNRVLLGGGKTLQSINGPDETVIQGGTNVRGAYLTEGAVLSGFTIRQGHVDKRFDESSSVFEHTRGGGVFIDNSGTVSNCIVRGNTAEQDGGGILLLDGGELINTLVVDNHANYGGGVYHMAGGLSANCTIVSNTAQNRGAGIFFNDGNSTSVNSIIRYNSLSGGGTDEIDWAMNEPSELRYCNTLPLPSGPGCFTNESLFANTDTWELAPDSPCIDAADPAHSPDTDFSGLPRPLDGGSGVAVPDLGIHERLVDGNDSDYDGIPDRWEIEHGLNPNADYDATENPDRDQKYTRCEYIADTDPLDPEDWFHVSGLLVETNHAYLAFRSSTGRVYTLEKTTNLVDGTWTAVPGQLQRFGTGGDDSLYDTNAPFGSSFYRINVELP